MSNPQKNHTLVSVYVGYFYSCGPLSNWDELKLKTNAVDKGNVPMFSCCAQVTKACRWTTGHTLRTPGLEIENEIKSQNIRSNT